MSWLPYIWNKVFQSGPSKVCGRKLLKNLKGFGLFRHEYFVSYMLHLGDVPFREKAICGGAHFINYLIQN